MNWKLSIQGAGVEEFSSFLLVEQKKKPQNSKAVSREIIHDERVLLADQKSLSNSEKTKKKKKWMTLSTAANTCKKLQFVGRLWRDAKCQVWRERGERDCMGVGWKESREGVESMWSGGLVRGLSLGPGGWPDLTPTLNSQSGMTGPRCLPVG